MLLFKFVLLSIFIITVNGYDQIVECSDATPMFNLTADTFTLLQSPSYPKTFDGNSPPSACHAKFSTADPTSNIWILMLNGGASELQFHDPHNTSNQLTKQQYVSNFDVVNFTTTSTDLLVNAFAYYSSEIGWSAYQAIVVPYPKDFKGCPLQSKTFDFSTDADTVIPVTHTFLMPDVELTYRACKWYFTVSTGQQLKVVVRNIDIGNNITVTLTNEKGPIYSFANTDINQVFYVDGEKFSFTYEFNYANISNTGFLILVSAITKTNTYTMNGCQPPSVDMASLTTNFTNIDYDNGYPPYQQCTSAVTIPENHEAILSVVEYDYEGISDKLTLNYGKNNSTEITWQTWKSPILYKLTSEISNAQLVFTSDGNTQGAGYKALLQAYECKCSNSIFVVNCEFETFLYPMNANNIYCSKLDCSYTILVNSTCPNITYFSLSVEAHLRDSIDYLLINDNQKTVQNVTGSDDADSYFSPNNNVTIYFHSGPSSTPVTTEAKEWYIQVKPIAKPTFTKITLDQTTSKYVQWLGDMKTNEAITVCTATGTLEIFIPHLAYNYDLRDFFLYDAGDLDNLVGTLNSIVAASASNPMYPTSKKSDSGCFTLYLPRDFPFDTDYSILFRNAEDASKNCQDSNNIFQVPSTVFSNIDVTVKSTTAGSCEMTILTSDYSNSVFMSHIWITNISVSDNDGQYTVSSAENGKELFSFKGSDAPNFQNFGVYTPALSIVAPPSATITISMAGVYQSEEWINILPNTIQKGIMASPSYSGFKQTFTTKSFYKSIGTSKFTATFNVKEINGNAQPILENDGKNQTLTKGTYTIQNKFALYYAESDPENNGFLIEYNIESGSVSLPPTDSTTVSTATEAIPDTEHIMELAPKLAPHIQQRNDFADQRIFPGLNCIFGFMIINWLSFITVLFMLNMMFSQFSSNYNFNKEFFDSCQTLDALSMKDLFMLRLEIIDIQQVLKDLRKIQLDKVSDHFKEAAKTEIGNKTIHLNATFEKCVFQEFSRQTCYTEKIENFIENQSQNVNLVLKLSILFSSFIFVAIFIAFCKVKHNDFTILQKNVYQTTALMFVANIFAHFVMLFRMIYNNSYNFKPKEIPSICAKNDPFLTEKCYFNGTNCLEICEFPKTLFGKQPLTLMDYFYYQILFFVGMHALMDFIETRYSKKIGNEEV